MKVLAIDPGYERIGIAVLEKDKVEKLLYSDCFITKKELPFSERLFLVGKEVETTIKKYKPNAVALEKVFFNTNQKTASMISEVRGAIIFIAGSYNLPTFEYTPQKVKAAITGYGKGGKEQVTRMVKQLIFIEKTIQYDDEYDAIAVGLTCLASERIEPLSR